MSIREFLALIVLVSLIVSLMVIVLGARFIESSVLSLFPAAASESAASALHLLLMEQAIATTILTVIIGFVCFWISGSVIASPLRKIIKAMDTFSTTGEEVPLPPISMAPTEIRMLSNVFANLTEKVTRSHGRDMEISRVKSDFISTAAHQLRTPLTGIRWALEALQKEDMPEGQKALVQSAVDKSHDLVSIVGTLLDISSIESGKYKYTFMPLNIGTVIEEVTRDFSHLAIEHNVTLYYAKTDELIPNVRADRERIKWVLNNLVENAVRYTPSGGSVHITTKKAPDRVYVMVHDTGIGIDAKDRSNIFERFYRAGNAITKENKGNGLGLYIARTIATDHGGDLNFAPNEDGPGTTFTLSLPITSLALRT